METKVKETVEVNTEKEKELELKTSNALAEAQAFTITSHEQYAEAGRRRDALKMIDTFIGELLDGPKDAAHKLWKSLVGKDNQYRKPVEDARLTYKKKMFAWEDEQEKIRLAEESRLAAEAKKKAEAEVLEAAQKAEDAGDKEEVERVLTQPLDLTHVVLPTSVPKLAGHTRQMVKKWRIRTKSGNVYTSADFQKKTIRISANDLTGGFPSDLLMLNPVALTATAERLGKAANIPGVEVYEEPA